MIEEGIYIIGDTHGCYQTLCKLIEQLPNKYESRICFVGDLIDRGPQSKQIIDLIQKYNYDCVLGNHEEGFIYEVDKIVDELERGVLNPHNTEWYKNWGGIRTIENYNFTFVSSEKTKIFEHKDFLKSLPIYKEYQDIKLNNKHLVVSHGYIGKFWEDRKYLRTQAQKNRFKESIIWSRDLSKIEKTIFNVFGHTPVKTPDITSFYANIDTGVYTKQGSLTCLHFPSLKTYTQKRLDRIR